MEAKDNILYGVNLVDEVVEHLALTQRVTLRTHKGRIGLICTDFAQWKYICCSLIEAVNHDGRHTSATQHSSHGLARAYGVVSNGVALDIYAVEIFRFFMFCLLSACFTLVVGRAAAAHHHNEKQE